MAHIWHVGNWCAHWGNEFRESAFRSSIKDFEVLNFARFLVDALQKIPAEVQSIPSWELYRMSPEQFADKLAWATSILFADVETQSLQLNPDFFADQFNRQKYVTFPDRFDILKQWIKDGGHFHMNGGWYSFSGHQGWGRWGRSSWQKDTTERVLPVECLEGDDLIESTASYEVRVVDKSHPAIQGIDWSTVPPLLGFNETRRAPGGNVILEIRHGNAWYPLLAESRFGKGRVTVWTSGASPHWGVNFMKWDQYDRFWAQLFAPESSEDRGGESACQMHNLVDLRE